LGAGTMGGGIAMNFANAGIPVTIVEVKQDALDRGLATIRKNYERTAQRGGITAEQVEQRAGLITGSLDMNAFADVDLVIEAVFERMDIKKDIFEKLDAICKPGAILATNTSALNIDEIASVTRRPEAVIGLHFFSPVPVIRLVEIVRALDTGDETIAEAETFVARLGKRSIECKDRAGFIVNFLLTPYLMGAVRMYEEGFATRDDIDAGMKLGANHPMGPLELCDFIGLDVLQAVSESLFDEFRRDEYAPPPLMKRMIAAGRLGRKSGRGFYEYPR